MIGVRPHRTARTGERAHQFELVLHLVAQDFRAQYRRTRIGWLWAVIQPLLLLVVYWFVFSRLHDFRGENYAMHVFIGVTVLTLFQGGVRATMLAPLARQDLIHLPGFDRRLVPVPALLRQLLDFLMTVPVLIGFALVEGVLSWTAVLMVIPLGIQLCLILGLGYLVGLANVKIRDVSLVMNTLLTLVFFVSPTFWTEESIPDQFDWILRVNPLAGLLHAYRNTLMFGELPSATRLAVPALTSFGLLVLGLVAYQRFGPTLGDEL